MNTINKPNIKKGPKGTSLFFLDKEQNIAYGNAKKEPKTTETKDSRTPNTNPKKVTNLTSPPPKDSLLKALSPNSFTRSINTNIIRPL